MAAREDGPGGHIAFAGLVEGRFRERLNRFAATVTLDQTRDVLVHVPSTGRMRELLLPDARVLLMRHALAHRKTHFDLMLTELPGGTGSWVCVDSRLPNRLLDRHWRRAVGPAGDEVLAVRREPRWGSGRFDFALTERTGERMVEVKSITLVRDGVGLFPDAPTTRGARHLLELAEYVAGGQPAAAVFVVQREDALVVRANRDTDPAFADALRLAVRAGVDAVAYWCRVDAGGVRVAGRLPVEIV